MFLQKSVGGFVRNIVYETDVEKYFFRFLSGRGLKSFLNRIRRKSMKYCNACNVYVLGITNAARSAFPSFPVRMKRMSLMLTRKWKSPEKI
jgi:hypothetical protein